MPLGRKDFTQEASDKLKPSSQKSTTEQLGDKASSTYDRAAAAVQPEYVTPPPPHLLLPLRLLEC